MNYNSQQRIAVYSNQRSPDDPSILVYCSTQNVPHENLSTKSNAPDGNDQAPCCRVTHCFHPLYDKVIQIVSTKKTWGEDRVFYHQEDGRLTSIPACWTSVYDSEVFNVISDGRSDFRFKELLQLARLVDSILSEGQ